MWIIPSYGRPDAPAKLLEAPGGMPQDVVVVVNEDDPSLSRYFDSTPPLWKIVVAPAGSRFCEAVRAAFESSPGDNYYGVIDDDYWPITPGWHDKMVAAAGGTKIAIANNLQNFPKLWTCRVMGGTLARAIGTIAPGKMRHNFSDDTWEAFAQDFNLLVPLEDVIVEHHHHSFGKSEKDDTYDRGSSDFDEDRKRFIEWRASDERLEQCKRVAALVGGNYAITNYNKVKLLICVPMQDTEVDIAFHMSINATAMDLHQRGISHAVQYYTGGSHIGKAREGVLWSGLRRLPDATHILFIDDDMGWEPKQVLRLIAADHDFAAYAGVKKKFPLESCFNGLPDVAHPVTKFMKIRHVGFAFVMLKRAVITRMCEAYPDLEYDTDGNGREWALFLDLMWRQAHKKLPERLSEDYSFCERWGRIGGDIWLDPQQSIIHAGRFEFQGSPAEVKAARA